jgi:hypothetical protein
MLNDLKANLIKYCRLREMERARGDIYLLQKLERTSDELLLRKWLWVVTITGTISTFIVTPFLLSLMANFIPPGLMTGLWLAVKVLMVGVVIIFFGTIYLTLSGSKD